MSGSRLMNFSANTTSTAARPASIAPQSQIAMKRSPSRAFWLWGREPAWAEELVGSEECSIWGMSRRVLVAASVGCTYLGIVALHPYRAITHQLRTDAGRISRDLYDRASDARRFGSPGREGAGAARRAAAAEALRATRLPRCCDAARLPSTRHSARSLLAGARPRARPKRSQSGGARAQAVPWQRGHHQSRRRAWPDR